MSGVIGWFNAIGQLFRRDQQPTATLSAIREQAYRVWDAYYDNRIYELESNGGQREAINRLLGNGAAADLAGLYNPVARVVDLYGHVFGGSFGTDITVETDNEALIEPLARIHRDSNMDVAKQRLTKYTPLHGNGGIRIVADRERGLVYLKMEHPQVVREIDQDDRGNTRAVLLEYDMEMGPLTKREVVRIRELQTKEQFQTWRIVHGTPIPFDLFSMQDNGPLSSYPNELGVVPYVLASHTAEQPWSFNAFHQQAGNIDRLNALLTHINIQIHEHVRGNWFIAAAGPEPREFDLSGKRVMYVNTTPGRGGESIPPPLVQSLVADLPLGDAIAQARNLMDIIEDALPELKATGGKFLAGQSGETISQLRKPAEDKIGLARTNLEHGLIKAQQIALSWGVLYNLWDLGTGMGTREAADAAYRNGAENHAFNQRPLLHLTEQERLTLALQKKTLGYSQEDILTEMGVKDVQAALERKQKETEASQAQFARAFDRGQAEPAGAAVDPKKEEQK